MGSAMLLPVSMVSRRHFLAGAGATAASLGLPLGLGAQEASGLTPDGFQVLHARAGTIGLGAPEAATPRPVWGYQGAVPGPLLRVKRGEELRVRLINALSEPTAVHWHGVRAPNLMDGTPGLTQSGVAADAHFDYRFRPPDAGTFWYHAPRSATPVRSADQEQAVRQRLYGVLIVEESEPVTVDREHVLVFDDWPMAPEDKPERTSSDPFQIRSFQVLANGTPAPDLLVRANERVRLRLVNAAKTRVVSLRLERHAAQVMARSPRTDLPAIHSWRAASFKLSVYSMSLSATFRRRSGNPFFRNA